MSLADQAIDLILEKSGEVDRKNLLKEMSLLIALSKKDKYQLECQKFEQKYGADFHAFEKELHTVKNQEDYQKENDLDDWEFALASLNWWEQRIEELINVSN